MGTRKQKAFYWTTLLLFVAFGAALFCDKGVNAAKMFDAYVMAQGIVTTGFFGGNFGEHWAKAKGEPSP